MRTNYKAHVANTFPFETKRKKQRKINEVTARKQKDNETIIIISFWLIDMATQQNKVII